ncbi:MAG: Tim44 domain-containing protein [Proteobacteria bacterium]|nr:Tim44 domain-containing protein [Pseudomonadota bacterium]HQR03515.1 TIM44-like domain-containing protein [Rhodocyclaceae bacterium]
MKRILIALFATVIGLGTLVHDAEAKRLGGGRSFGMSRSAPASQPHGVPAKPAAPAQQATPTQQAQPGPAAPQPSGARRWLGPIAGLAAGLGLAALFSHLGMGEGFGTVVMVMLLVFAAIALLRMVFAQRRQPVYAGQANTPNTPAAAAKTSDPADTAAPSSGGRCPFGFGGDSSTSAGAGASATVATEPPPRGEHELDAASFLRMAKLNFVRLQAANDAGNMADIKEFSTPEFYAEIEMQYLERGKVRQQTDVVQLDAEVLDVDRESERFVASVRFHGMIREEANAAPETFNEIWHLTKPVDGSAGWVVAGIQQAASA